MSTSQPRQPTLHSLGLDAVWLASRIEESPALLDLIDGVPRFERTLPTPGADRFAAIPGSIVNVYGEPVPLPSGDGPTPAVP